MKVLYIWENHWSMKKNLFSKERNKTCFSRMENSYFSNLFSQVFTSKYFVTIDSFNCSNVLDKSPVTS